MSRCFIFGAGDAPEYLPVVPMEGDTVIAADGGYLTCCKENIVPDLLVGDFDSMDEPADFPHILRHPVEKDDTDTFLAARKALELGCDEVHIYGGTGGRLDHTLANLQLLMWLRQKGGKGYLYDGAFTYTAIINEAITVKKEKEWALLSVFCMGADAHGVSERGVQYPLDRADLTAFFPLGVSNHILEETAEVSVEDGALVVCWER